MADSQNHAGLKEARSQENTAYMISFIWNPKKFKSIVMEGESVVALGLDVGLRGLTGMKLKEIWGMIGSVL